MSQKKIEMRLKNLKTFIHDVSNREWISEGVYWELVNLDHVNTFPIFKNLKILKLVRSKQMFLLDRDNQ